MSKREGYILFSIIASICILYFVAVSYFKDPDADLRHPFVQIKELRERVEAIEKQLDKRPKPPVMDMEPAE